MPWLLLSRHRTIAGAPAAPLRPRPRRISTAPPAPPPARDVDFPELFTRELREQIIFEWQAAMEVKEWIRRPCIVCAQLKFTRDLRSHFLSDDDFDLLRDVSLPEKFYPKSYDFGLYRKALLHPHALTERYVRAFAEVCTGCLSALKRKSMPVDAIANKLYYVFDCLPAEVARAFKQASYIDKMYVAACRMTRITHIIDNPADDKRVLPPHSCITPSPS